jgi:hypothetical protein
MSYYTRVMDLLLVQSHHHTGCPLPTPLSDAGIVQESCHSESFAVSWIVANIGE